MDAEHVIVMSTTDSEQAARQLAADAVRERLAACAQIVGPITSVFRWEGDVQTEAEWRLEFKTAADRSEALRSYIIEHHGYDVPEVVVVPVTAGSPEYLTWVRDETR